MRDFIAHLGLQDPALLDRLDAWLFMLFVAFMALLSTWENRKQ